MTEPLPFPVVLDAHAMSDLFFNHDNSHRHELYTAARDGDISAEDEDAALRKDAHGFCDCLNAALSASEREALVDWLMNDFHGRL